MIMWRDNRRVLVRKRNKGSRGARPGGEALSLAALNNSQMDAMAILDKAPLQITTLAKNGARRSAAAASAMNESSLFSCLSKSTDGSMPYDVKKVTQ